MRRYLQSIGFILFAGLIGGCFSSSGDGEKITWQVLQGLDYQSGQADQKVEALEDKLIRIPGFALPYDSGDRIGSFMLMPSEMSCVHVPPPPPNQVIEVKMRSKVAAKKLWGPIWVTGKLSIVKEKSEYGKAGFRLEGTRVEPYSQ